MNKSNGQGVRDWAYKKLKQDVISGKLGPGKRLKEVELAEKMAISRTPIREALTRLETDGLVSSLPNRGYKVANLTMQNIEEVFGVREVLEAYAGKLATSRITWEKIHKLESILKQSEEQFEKGSEESLIKLNTNFHETITGASGNSLVLALLEQLNNNILRYRTILIQHRTLFLETIKEHRRILHFLKMRDPQSVHQEIGNHIRKTMEKLLSHTSEIS